MSFIDPPKYDENLSWNDFVGYTVVVEPVKRQEDVRTRYGDKDMWTCRVWVLEEDGNLTPNNGIAIFNDRLIQQLDLAADRNSQIPGMVVQQGQSVRLTQLDDATLAAVKVAWQVRNKPVAESL